MSSKCSNNRKIQPLHHLIYGKKKLSQIGQSENLITLASILSQNAQKT